MSDVLSAISAIFSFSGILFSGTQLLFALVLDHCLGEPKRWHPLIAFGHIASGLERHLNSHVQEAADAAVAERRTRQGSSSAVRRVLGAAAWFLLVLPVPLILWALNHYAITQSHNGESIGLTALIWLANTWILYSVVAMRSLKEHAMQIYHPLLNNDIDQARYYTGYIVSRDTHALSPQDMSRATVESVLENGHDGVIASLFYFLIGGAPLAVLHRFANTLDAMWGYKTPRFLHFGWWSARADDHLGWLSTYCTSVLYVLAASPPIHITYLTQAWQQAKHYKSQNGGRCMATGALVLGFRLGGTAHYQGTTIHSPTLGQGPKVSVQDIPSSVALVQRSAWLLAVLVIALGIALHFIL